VQRYPEQPFPLRQHGGKQRREPAAPKKCQMGPEAKHFPNISLSGQLWKLPPEHPCVFQPIYKFCYKSHTFSFFFFFLATDLCSVFPKPAARDPKQSNRMTFLFVSVTQPKCWSYRTHIRMHSESPTARIRWERWQRQGREMAAQAQLHAAEAPSERLWALLWSLPSLPLCLGVKG